MPKTRTIPEQLRRAVTAYQKEHDCSLRAVGRKAGVSHASLVRLGTIDISVSTAAKIAKAVGLKLVLV